MIPLKLLWLALGPGFAAPALAAGEISAYRRVHGLSAVKPDSRLDAMALTQARWENSAGHRENLLMVGAKKIGVVSVDNPKSPYRKFWAMVITD
jgi:uncharacterized protein YkwD